MEEKLDVLGRDYFIQKLVDLVKLVSDNKQSCCFGINGAWGSGKSFVLEKFEKRVKDIQLEETADNKYFLFHYDCWKYDYYEEPAIAIISAMLEVADKEINMFTEEVNSVLKLSWETTKNTLAEIARELCKNKVGIDLVAVAEKSLEEHDKAKLDDFDSLYGFKRALEETRKNIQKIANDKTVVVVVDELDRCLPEYSIKVLERLHHIFTNLCNIIVIVSMDKVQLEHSIKGIYGAETDVDAYLRKFISFKVDLNNGNAGNYICKYESYTSMFDILDKDKILIEKFFSDIMDEMPMRNQEQIFRKAEIIHKMIVDEKIRDSSIMTFEILFLTVALRLKTTDLKWIVEQSHYVNVEEKLGKKYYTMLRNYELMAKSGRAYNGKPIIQDNVIGETFFWLANVFDTYENGVCNHYVYRKCVDMRLPIVKNFVELIEIVDTD